MFPLYSEEKLKRPCEFSVASNKSSWSFPFLARALQITKRGSEMSGLPAAAYDICQKLFDEPWKSYATDRHKAPQAEGIYAIGFLQSSGNITCVYMGHSTNIQGRLQDHMSEQNVALIDVYVKQQFQQYPVPYDALRVKWVEEKNGQCAKEKYYFYFPSLLGYCPHGGPAYDVNYNHWNCTSRE
ncbi:hypothetical protein ACROYT_G038262 [Oculina patagonica]